MTAPVGLPAAGKESQGRVLIVDDEEPIRVALTRTLRRLGYEVTCAADAEAGMAAVVASDPEVIFLDLRMPGTDGHTFLRHLQAANHLHPPSVIVMSGQGQMEDVIEILRQGAIDYLRKPWNLTELMSAVTRGLELRRKPPGSAPNAELAAAVAPSAPQPGKEVIDRFASLQTKLRQGEIVLPAMPAILVSLRTVVEDPRSSIDEVAAIVASDARITVDILRTANSPQFMHMPRATNAKAAVSRLGLRHVHNLVQTIFLQGLCEVHEGAYRKLLKLVWRRSVARALAMRALCDLVDPAQTAKGLDGDTAYFVGLMADVGASLLLWIISEKAQGTLTADDVRDTTTALQVLRRTHEDLGKALLERWSFDKVIGTIVAQHHRDTPPATHTPWWCLFVLGDRLATILSGEEDPTASTPQDTLIVERCAAEFGIPPLMMRRLATELQSEYQAIQQHVT
jgi:HD-like signal output (HDOD) protein/FixJ family two-component response regulator